MFCENCGTKLSDGARFCSGCGSAVADITLREPVKRPVKKPVKRPSSDTENGVVAAPAKEAVKPATDFDYGDFATHSGSAAKSSQGSYQPYDYSSTDTGSVSTNEINRNSFLLIAVGYGLLALIFYSVVIWRSFNYFNGFYAIAEFFDLIWSVFSYVLQIAFVVYFAGALLCVNKLPFTRMAAYMLPSIIPFVYLLANMLITGYLYSFMEIVISFLGTCSIFVVVGGFALLTNERIVRVDHPIYPFGLAFALLGCRLIAFCILYFICYHTPVFVRNAIEAAGIFICFAAVQFFEMRREL